MGRRRRGRVKRIRTTTSLHHETKEEKEGSGESFDLAFFIFKTT